MDIDDDQIAHGNRGAEREGARAIPVVGHVVVDAGDGGLGATGLEGPEGEARGEPAPDLLEKRPATVAQRVADRGAKDHVRTLRNSFVPPRWSNSPGRGRGPGRRRS